MSKEKVIFSTCLKSDLIIDSSTSASGLRNDHCNLTMVLSQPLRKVSGKTQI